MLPPFPVRESFDAGLGELHDICAHRFTPKAELKGFATVDECVLALQAGRVDAEMLAATIRLSTFGKNAALRPYRLLNAPIVSAMGFRRALGGPAAIRAAEPF